MNRVRLIALFLAGTIVLISGFHFWPFEGRRTWEIVGPLNGPVLLWLAAAGVICLLRRDWAIVRDHLPHVSLMGYVLVVGLSLAFAPDTARAGSVIAKVLLACMGGYLLFSYAACTKGGLRALYTLAVLSTCLSVAACLIGRLGYAPDSCGFFGSPYKYGTYIGMFVPLCGTILLLNAKSWVKILGGILVLAGLVSSESLGGAVGICCGMAVATLLAPSRQLRLTLVGVLMCATLTIGSVWTSKLLTPLRQDVVLREKNGTDLRQRYIEWQAFSNLLEDRTITGTGAGGANEYGSAFYYRLPKLNTIKPFDQNGWLVTAAEGGLLALMCFTWAFVHYFIVAWQSARAGKAATRSAKAMYGTANCAGLAGAGVANIFSSLQYNGILVLFIALMALTQQASLFEEKS